MTREELALRVEERRADLASFVARHGGASLRHETAEDLVQGVVLRALDRADEFAWRSEPEFLAWLYRVARSHLADRRAHWLAEKRRPARLLRLTRADSTDPGAGSAREPATPDAGPVTSAERREDLERALAALELLLPRDAELVRRHADGATLEDEAARLGITYAAAQRARLRALERYRRAFRLVE